MSLEIHHHSRRENLSRLKVFLHASLLLVAFSLNSLANCEQKEFDWSDLGVSLTGPKSTITGGAGNNLRILVSPQRRMTKNYEFEYSNNSHSSPIQGEANYVIPGSAGSYASQSAAGHSSAYSALSASLASLKNRLNARGVSLTGGAISGSDSGSQPTIYANGASAYSTSLLADSQQQQAQQGQAPQTYLSVNTATQEQQSQPAYSVSQAQANDNKTIVLAIPAKINFLTENHSSGLKQQSQHQQQQQQQQQQQVGPQMAGEQQQTRTIEYGAKQIGIEGALDQNGQIVASQVLPQEPQQQYVIVNSTPTEDQASAQQQQQHQMSSSLYTNVYPKLQANTQGSIAMKYVPAYQQPIIQVPAIQKIYTTGQQQQQQENNYNTQADESSSGRYSCPDTCNSADSRWKNHSVSKYKYCCSRSNQYDPQFEHPSVEKVSDSSKSADDAFYSYLYRKTRSRRSRRPHRSNRYYSRQHSPSVPSNSDEENSNGESGGQSETGRQTSGRSYHHESPYMKYYKSRQQQSYEATGEAQDSKYSNKERAHRRGRSRELDAPENQYNQHETSEEEASYQPSSSYGSGEYAVEGGQYPPNSQPETRNPYNEEEEATRGANYEEAEQEASKSAHPADAAEYSGEQTNNGSEEATEQEAGSYKYKKGRKYQVKSRSKKGKHSRRARKSKAHNKQEYPTSQTNGTDYDSAQAGGESASYHPDQSGVNNEEEQGISYQAAGESNTSGSGDSDKEATLLGNKYKSNLNDSAVANLSRTTMHLKEILSLLEKKAQLKVNGTTTGQQAGQQQATSTPPPATTTNVYPLSWMSSSYNSPALQSLTSDFLTSELNLKSPYRFEPSTLTSSLSSSGLSLPSPFSSDPLSSYSSFGSSQYGMPPQKHLPISNGHPYPKKRRVNKNIRYNNMMVHKPHTLGHPSMKNPYVNSAYYPSLQYPYWYPRTTQSSMANAYRQLNKNPYAALGPLTSKLAAAAVASTGLYTDESRYHGPGYDSIPAVASSLRQSTAMRLRHKPMVFQPHVLPIYSRHTILTQPIDVKK